MKEATPQRRRFQFGLRTLMVLITVSAVVLSWVAAKMSQVRAQRAAAASLRERRAKLGYSKEFILPAWLRTVVRDDTLHVAWVDFGPCYEPIEPVMQQMEDLRQQEEQWEEERAAFQTEFEDLLKKLGSQAPPIPKDDMDAYIRFLKLRLDTLWAVRRMARAKEAARSAPKPEETKKGGQEPPGIAIVPAQGRTSGAATTFEDPFSDGFAHMPESFSRPEADESVCAVQAVLRQCNRLEIEQHENRLQWWQLEVQLGKLGVECPPVKTGDPRKRLHRLERIVAGLKQWNIGDDELALVKSFTKLRILNGVGPQVTDAGLAHLKGLKELRSLDLSGSKVTGAGLIHLQNLPKLRLLDLRRTQVTDAGLAHLKGPGELESLDLSGTKITGTGLIHLQNVPKLRLLDLHETRVTDAALAHLKGLKQLESLDLSGTKITGTGLVHLQNLSKLRLLNLRETCVTDSALAHLKGLKQLESLYLSETNISGAGLVHLQNLPKLRLLVLRGTHLTDAAMAHVAKMGSLAKLNISQTEVTDAGLAHLRGLANLEYLNLYDTRVSEGAVKTLKETLPNCSMY